ncbi:MAG: HAMP domain-containing sensor histidine kinase [Acidobacteriota bacterium]|jgi:signal transduction histidine kinase
MKRKTNRRSREDRPARSRAGGLRAWLAVTNLVYVLPLLFVGVTLFLWQWSMEQEGERIRLLTDEEASRAVNVILDRLQGHADMSARSGNRWLLRDPRDQPEWDYDLFSRRWLHPELETVEWIGADLEPRFWPSNQKPVLANVVGRDDLDAAATEHRVVLAGPYYFGDGHPVSLTIVPVERGDATEWVVSAYDLGRVLRFTLQGANASFAMALLSDGREVFASHEQEADLPAGWERTVDLEYDRLDLQLHVWPRPVTLDRFRTRMPQMVLIGGIMAAVVLALGIRLAQVSARRAIEARMTASLQDEVRARGAAEKLLERRVGELSRSNQEFERFAYAISHDLRDPLNTIHLNLQLVLAQEDETSATERRRLRQAATAVERLDTMIGRLLEYARAGGGGDSLELVAAEEALDDAVANLEALIVRHEASVSRGTLPNLIAHRAALTRLFQNLVSNALKYRAERPPEVTVEAVKSDEEWVFSVADNARGMSDKDIRRAFDLFWRHDDGGDTAGEGIGLAVCKRIVERHGGRMWIESRQGQGTTFFFTWPADPDAGAGRGVSEGPRT